MRWRRGRRSTNIEDRRGQRTGRRFGGGFGRGFGGRRTRLSGGMIAVVVVVSLLLGENPLNMLQMVSSGGGGFSPAPVQRSGPINDEAGDFVSVVLADTEDAWSKIFSNAGATYQPPKLVLFTDAVRSACGFNSSATGPFYCPPDRKVYIDLGFFNELSRMGAPGDFAQAYVIGHEVGHHIQNLVGTAEKVHRAKQQVSRKEANALSVRMELQADCYAGVWAYHANRDRQLLEEGDVEEGLRAAAAIGDDRLQQSAGRHVNPDSFTHGSSEQRVAWFRKGLNSGRVDACNTFAE